jgi:Sulfotransferase domain
MLPNFLVIGTQRAGTSLLHHKVLAPHPQVYVPRERKEVHFFDRHFENGRNWYETHFPKGEEAGRYRAVGEITPDYLAHPLAAERIHDVLPTCRLIAILRDPVERCWSMYQYERRRKAESRDFDAFLEYDPSVLEYGLYHKQLRRYLEFFPWTLLVLIYEELIANPEQELEKLAAFLKIDMIWSEPGAAAAVLNERVNHSGKPRFGRSYALASKTSRALGRRGLRPVVRAVKALGVKEWFGSPAPRPAVPSEVRARLAAFYANDIVGLSALLGRDPWRTA